MFCSKCGTQIAEDSAFCSKCGNRIAHNLEMATVSPQEIEIPRYSASEIKEYLSHARTLEVNRHTLITAKSRLQQIINSLGHRKNIPHPASHASEGFNSFWPTFGKAFLVGLIITILISGDPLGNLICLITVALALFNQQLLLGILASAAGALIFSFIVCLIKTAIKKAEYNAEYKEYCQKVDDDKKRVALENAQICALGKQQQGLNAEIKKVDSMLQKFYALDVIKPKYRELIPVVTMYEYFDNERCFSLIGPNGAYNLYEDELLHKTIIANLNQAVAMLSQIAQNQHALYEAIQESNDYAERMYHQANAMLKTSKAIEHNTAIAAYNSKIAADNSTISAYIDVYKL